MSSLRPPTVNLARRPFRNNTVYYGVFITCFVLMLTASAYNVYDFVTAGGEISRLEQEYAERQTEYVALRDEVDQMKRSVNTLDLTTLNAKSTFANGLILSRLFSWSKLFDRIEEMLPPNVKIRSIRPSISAKGIEIQLDGMARAPEDLYEFEQALVSSDYFSAVYPVSENTKEGRGELNFDITMDYVPAGKSQVMAGTATVPATPTEGLPQPPSSGQAATDPNASPVDPNAAAQADAGQPPAASGAPSPAPAAAVAGQAPGPLGGTQPAAAPAEEPVQAAAEEVAPAQPTKPAKPPRLLTNKEFIDQHGEARFLMARGKLKPAAQGKDAGITNEEFIAQRGMAEFLKTRGQLTRDQMLPPVPAREASDKAGGKP